MLFRPYNTQEQKHTALTTVHQSERQISQILIVFIVNFLLDNPYILVIPKSSGCGAKDKGNQFSCRDSNSSLLDLSLLKPGS
jgi:hypothetical protein